MSAVNDPVIPDWEVLIRRVVVNQNSVKMGPEGQLQFTTAGFKLDSDGVSLYRSQLLQILGLTPRDVVSDRQQGVPVALMAGHIRAAGCGLNPDPISIPKDAIDPAHALMSFDLTLSRPQQKQQLRKALEKSFVLSKTLTVSGEPPASVVMVHKEPGSSLRLASWLRRLLRR